MPWPHSQDYNEAMQHPGVCLSDAELRQGEAKTNALGLPVPCSGNFADVYQIRNGARSWAVKCFTREIPGLRERYNAISAYLQNLRLPFMVAFEYLDQGVRVAGKWYPVLKMDWVEGYTLNEFVKRNLAYPQVLGNLAQLWVTLARLLREANLGHCDLQHGNVLLVPMNQTGTVAIMLVDYDGMWVPALQHTRSHEVGHPAYQHPQRLREGVYSLGADRFSHLVIYTALRALMVGGKALWDKYDNGDNLLFKQTDFEAPRQSPVFQELLRFPDADVRKLAQALATAAGRPLEQTQVLDELIASSRPAESITAARPKSQALAAATVRPAAAQGRPRDFDRGGSGGVRRPPRRGVPGWVWLAGGVAAVVVVVVVVLVVGNGSRPKTPDDPPVAAKGPGDDDRPKDADKTKDADPDRKKDKTDTPEKPAPLPRLVAFPKLSLPERGAADLQVKVERQGYAGPIKLQVENLPPGVTCQRSATIPAGESALRLEFRTDGTAAEGTATVEVIATADMRTADRQKLALLLPPKSAASAKPPEPLPTTWKSLAGMPTARSLLAAVTGPDGRIYAIGGEDASGRLDIVEVYDPSTNKWTKAAPMPTARNHLAATVGPDNLIYAIGGVSTIPKIVEAYNPSTNKWTTVADTPTARHGMAAATGPDGRIYALGGTGPAGVPLNTVEAYDTKSDTWTTVASMPTARVYLAAAMGPDGRIYAIGGIDSKRLDTVEAYDTKTNKWTTVASMPTARNALAAATGPDGRIYAIGGHPEGGNLNPAEAYDPSTNKWTTVASMPTVRGQLAATTGRDGRIYAIGGGGNVRFLNTVEALSFSTSK